MATKILVVGRHTPDLGAEAASYEIVAQENVMFSLNRDEVVDQVLALEAKAAEVGVEAILLQNIPAVVAVALVNMTKNSPYRWMGDTSVGGIMPRWGVIVSVPGPRVAGVTEQFNFDYYEVEGQHAAERAVKFANARAKTEIVNGNLLVTVDPVPLFVFDHIEWF